MGTKRDILLVADDFGISEGVSEGIASLASEQRISATSAFVTLPRWRHDGPRLAALRGHIAIGLHLNLTLGAPLGGMPRLAPDGRLPRIGRLLLGALGGRLHHEEIAREVCRQLTLFEDVTGFAPDHIDGHQHVHAMPVVRDGVVAAIKQHFADREPLPLIRNPCDSLGSILRRPAARTKSAALHLLCAGLSAPMARAGLPANDSFAGVTGFGCGEQDVAHDFAAALREARGLHLVMCHPGHPTAELAALDPVTERRARELAVLARENVLSERIWYPKRASDGPRIDWAAVMKGLT